MLLTKNKKNSLETILSLSEFNQNIIPNLKLYNHLINSLRTSKNIIRKAMPSLYLETNYSIEIEESDENGASTLLNEQNNKRIITFKIKSPSNTKIQRTETQIKKTNDNYSQEISHLIFSVHEYAHILYYKLTNEILFKDTQEEYYETLDSVINEGFALMTEYITSKYLIDLNIKKINQEILSWHEDITKISKNSPSYEDGYKLMFQIYNLGGTQGIKNLLSEIDRTQLIQIKRGNQKYQELLDSANFLK